MSLKKYKFSGVFFKSSSPSFPFTELIWRTIPYYHLEPSVNLGHWTGRDCDFERESVLTLLSWTLLVQVLRKFIPTPEKLIGLIRSMISLYWLVIYNQRFVATHLQLPSSQTTKESQLRYSVSQNKGSPMDDFFFWTIYNSHPKKIIING